MTDITMLFVWEGWRFGANRQAKWDILHAKYVDTIGNMFRMP
jgi:hypothetical protein